MSASWSGLSHRPCYVLRPGENDRCQNCLDVVGPDRHVLERAWNFQRYCSVACAVAVRDARNAELFRRETA